MDNETAAAAPDPAKLAQHLLGLFDAVHLTSAQVLHVALDVDGAWWCLVVLLLVLLLFLLVASCLLVTGPSDRYCGTPVRDPPFRGDHHDG